MKNKLISIITPVYNAEKFISKTIESVINQTYTNWELILIDDCSTDDSYKIIKQYIEKDQRIKYIKLYKNSGPCIARNTGIKLSMGRYISFLDSDDLWYPEKLEKQFEFMTSNNYRFTCTGYKMMSEEGNLIGKSIDVPYKIDYKKLLNANTIPCLTVMLDSKYIKKEDIVFENIKHEDYVLWLSILKKGYFVYGLNDKLAMYRKTSNSVSSNKIKSAQWQWSIYRDKECLSLLKSIWCFINYFKHGIMRHIL